MPNLPNLQNNSSGMRTFTATAAIIYAFRLLKMSSGSVVQATTGDEDFIGTSLELDVAASGNCPVLLSNAQGTRFLTAGAAISAGAALMATTAGKVITHDGSALRSFGKALTAATTDGDVIEVAMYPSSTTEEGLMTGIVGDGLNVSTVTFSSIVAGDELTLSIDGETPVVLTAIAASGTPTSIQFKVGAATNPAGDITAATNCAAAIAALAATSLLGVTVSRVDAVMTIKCTKLIVASPSSGDGAKVVCVNDTESDDSGTLTERSTDARVRLTAIEASDTVHKARTTVLEAAVDVVEADILSSAGSTHEGITITLSSAVADNAIVFNGATRTFKASPSGITQVQLGGSDTASATNLAANLNNIVGVVATSSGAVVTAYFPTAITATENTSGTTIVIAAVTNDHSNAQLDTRVTAVEATTAALTLTLLAATGNIAANSPVTITAETSARFAYGSTSVETSLYGFSSAGGTAAAACSAVPWLSRAKHTCRKTAAAVAIGDLVYLAASGQIATVTAGAGKVVIGIATTASAGAADVLIDVAPIVPYLTAA